MTDRLSLRATKQNILSFATSRRVLGELARTIAGTGLEQNEAAELLAVLIGELEALQRGDASADVWRQATADFTGIDSYGLDRVGLWPPSPEMCPHCGSLDVRQDPRFGATDCVCCGETIKEGIA